MRKRIRARVNNETGAGLVELLVAMTIIVMIVVGTAALMARILGFQESAESLDKGVQVARDYIERAKGVDFNQLGFYEHDPGFTPFAANGEETVVIPPEEQGSGLLPIDTRTVGNTEFTIKISITRLDAESTYSPKRVSLTISWLDDRRTEQKTSVGILRSPTISEMIPPSFDLTEIEPDSGVPSAPSYFEDQYAGAFSALYGFSEFTVGVMHEGAYEVSDLMFTVKCPASTPVTVYWASPDEGWSATRSGPYYNLRYERINRPAGLNCHIEDATTDIVAINEAGNSPPLTVEYGNFQDLM